MSFPHTAPQMPADWILDPAEEGLAAWVCSALGAERVWADAYFARVPADSPLLGLSGRPDVRVRRALAPFVTRLAPTWDAQLRAYSRKRRKHIRHVERLDKFGPAARVRIACFPEEDDDLERLLADVGTVVRQTWKARTVDIDRYCRLTGDVMRGMARRDRLVAFLLRDGDRPLAYFANLALAGRLFPYVTAFHPDAAAGSPGALLIAATLRYGCAHGYREVHFGSDRPHVSHWARERSAYYHVRLFNDTVRGRLLRALSGRAA